MGKIQQQLFLFIYFYVPFLNDTYRGQTRGDIFTIDDSNDENSCKDVPFVGFVYTAPHFRGEIPPNHDRHFQAKWAKYTNFHIIETTASLPTKFCTTTETTT